MIKNILLAISVVALASTQLASIQETPNLHQQAVEDCQQALRQIQEHSTATYNIDIIEGYFSAALYEISCKEFEEKPSHYQPGSVENYIWHCQRNLKHSEIKLAALKAELDARKKSGCGLSPLENEVYGDIAFKNNAINRILSFIVQNRDRAYVLMAEDCMLDALLPGDAQDLCIEEKRFVLEEKLSNLQKKYAEINNPSKEDKLRQKYLEVILEALRQSITLNN